MRRSFVQRAARVAALFALYAGPALAQPRPDPGGHGIERLLERNAERLQLDDATRGKIRSLAEAGRERSAPQREALRQLHEEMHALLTSDAPELDAVLAKAEQLGAAETALHKERLRTMLEIRALLTPEQRRELVRIHEEFRAEHPEWGQGGPRRWRDHGGRE
jgi:Spy/CpxP family protein refolding chaperone